MADGGAAASARQIGLFDAVETHVARLRRYVAEGVPLFDAPRVVARIEASEARGDYPPCRCSRCVAARGLG